MWAKLVFVGSVSTLFSLTVGLSDDGCPTDGWFIYDRYCYRMFQQTPVTWTSARTSCQALGSDVDLASIWNSNIREALKENVFAAVPGDLRCWLGLQRRYSRWHWVDGSSGGDLGGWDPDDARYVADTGCVRASIVTSPGLYQAYNCTEELEAYMCKTGQHLAYEMGLPWMTYPNTGRQVRMQDNSADKRSSFFFRQLSPQTVFSVAPVLTRLSTWEVVHCALHCLGTPTCMAVEVYCKVRDKCEWISCTLKAAP